MPVGLPEGTPGLRLQRSNACTRPLARCRGEIEKFWRVACHGLLAYFVFCFEVKVAINSETFFFALGLMRNRLEPDDNEYPSR